MSDTKTDGLLDQENNSIKNSFDQSLDAFDFGDNQGEDTEANSLDDSDLGLRELVKKALKMKGGVTFLQNLEDKEFVALMKSVIPSEMKVKVTLTPHEDFLRELNTLNTVDVEAKEIDNDDLKFLVKT